MIRTVSSHFDVKHLFSVSGDALGIVEHNNDVCFYYFSEQRWSESEITSKCKPCVNGTGHLCVLYDDGIHFYDLSFTQTGQTLAIKDILCEMIYTIKKVSLSCHALEEIGSLSFGSEFCKAINRFYKAISYAKPGRGEVFEKISIKKSIEFAHPLVNLLKDMETSLKEKFSRNSFQGEFGSVWSRTISCIVDTVESWTALVRRLDFFDQTIADKVFSHCITNESWIEHSFGFTTKKGQGHLQNMQEYVESKRRHAIDFQIRMTDAPFCQYTKTKIRDKGYQTFVDVGKPSLVE